MRFLAALVLVVLAACPAPRRGGPTIENRSVEDMGSPIRPDYPNGPITSDSLAGFLSWRFGRQLDEKTFVAEYNDTQDDVIDELHTMGINDLHQLATIIPGDFEVMGAGEFITDDPANIPGLVRDFLMIHDARLYFDRAWKSRWQSILPANVSALRSYVLDFQPFYDAGVLTVQEVNEAPRPTARHPGLVHPAPAAPAGAPGI